jgi:sulfatase maturation enzyme AslB (radical SAM superfamily)
MSFEVGKKLIDTVFNELQETHFAIILSFIGGEPLLQPQLISDLVDYWDYKCIMENIN